MKKFYISECPDNSSVFSWLSENTNFQEAVRDIQTSFKFKTLIDIPHRLDIDQIVNNTISALDKFGIKGWQTTKGESKAYGGLSMTYNPDLAESVDPNQNTLGTKTNKPDMFYYGSTEKFSSIRNTYFDSYGFRKLSPCITGTELKNLINGFNLSLTRSRIGVLDADYHDKVGEEFLWHKDETVFENLRINIPIDTDPSFMFQIENTEPMHLELGKIYTWDTHLAHRVYATKKSVKKRTHLVLGFSPWFDYLENEDAYVTNSFFGKVHPFDIILQGLAHPDIGQV